MIFSLLIRGLPILTLFVALILQELAVYWAAWSALRPDLLLTTLIYWHIYRPDRCGPGVAFTMGLCTDLFASTPLGLQAFTKTLLVSAISHQIRFIKMMDFLSLLLILFLCAFTDLLLQSVIMWLLRDASIPWLSLLERSFATIFLAPLVVALLISIHRQWLEDH